MRRSGRSHERKEEGLHRSRVEITTDSSHAGAKALRPHLVWVSCPRGQRVGLCRGRFHGVLPRPGKMAVRPVLSEDISTRVLPREESLVRVPHLVVRRARSHYEIPTDGKNWLATRVKATEP